MADQTLKTDLRPIVGKALRPVKVRDLGVYAFHAAADGLDNLSAKLHQKYVRFGFRDVEMHLAAQSGDKLAVVKLLVDGVDPSAPHAGKGITPLARAIENHHNDVANILLNATFRRDPSRIDEPATHSGETLAHIATKSSNWTALESLLRFKPDVNRADHEGMSPINLVAQNGDVTLLKSMVAHGGDPHTLDNNEMPVAYHVLIGDANDKVEMLKVLKSAGANLTGKFGDENISLLSVASEYCTRDVVEHLMLTPGMDLNSMSSEGLTPLHFSALNTNPGVTQALLQHGAQPNAVSNGNLERSVLAASPLMIAAAKNNFEAVDALLDDSRTNILLPSPGTKDNALTIAESRGHQEVSKLIQSKLRQRVNAVINDVVWQRPANSRLR